MSLDRLAQVATTRAVFPYDDEIPLIREFFRDIRQGYFVEVGAHDPVKDSQTLHLEQIGWTGILIEPQPDLAHKLHETRRAKVFAVACSSPERAGQTGILHVAGAFSSFDEQLMVSGARASHAIEVPLATLDEVLSEGGAPVNFDLLSVDVEGHEIEVLRGFDFLYWRPRLILLEDHVVGLDKHRFLEANDYRLMRRTGLNAWYVPREHAWPLGWRERWDLFRKYRLGLRFRLLREAIRRRRHGA
ncbi:MAG TPA: FkbM family methyltransferase [Xanthobacteraceae bacterium]|nr:FkbM family methyltransferase [Xanthobacteraceae bacterium]